MEEDKSVEIIGHDSPLDEKCRVYASISFAVILLGIGLPLWWYTTEVPRAPIPFSWIESLDKLETKIGGKILIGCFEKHRCEKLVDDLELRFFHLDIYNLRISYFLTENSPIKDASTAEDLKKIEESYDVGYGDLMLLEAPDPGDHVHVGSGRTVYFSTLADSDDIADVLRDWIFRNDALKLTMLSLTEPTKYSLDVENRRRFPASPSYDVLLTIVNPAPSFTKIDRSLYYITEDYLNPFLDEVSLIANFSLKSQWIYLLPLGVRPKKVPDMDKSQRHFALREELLPQIITPLEKKLASHVSLYPTINLVLYVMPCYEAPLYIYGKNGKRAFRENDFQSFHSPRWGGIVISNPPMEECIKAQDNSSINFTPSKHGVSGVFMAQLRLLLGIPETSHIEFASIAPIMEKKVRSWELDHLLRIRSVEQLTSAKLTLQSLAKLLRGISNIVITETVGNHIVKALHLIEESTRLLNEGDLKNGFLTSREAFVISEAAFTDPSLLALLYFPDDQKYAVYIPLFLPVMIPVLFSLKNIRKYFKSHK